MNRNYLIALYVVILIVIIVVYYYSTKTTTTSNTNINNTGNTNTGNTNTGTNTTGTIKQYTYTFYQGMDNDGLQYAINQEKTLIDNIPALKAKCDSLSNCVGFNTNGWMFHTLKPQSQWTKWTNDTQKGLYIKNK